MPQIGRLTASAVKIAGLFFAQYSPFRVVEEFNFLNDEKKGCKFTLTAFLVSIFPLFLWRCASEPLMAHNRHIFEINLAVLVKVGVRDTIAAYIDSAVAVWCDCFFAELAGGARAAARWRQRNAACFHSDCCRGCSCIAF
jgi:hypothetical protein